jgi:hypothetical protein
MKPPRVRFTVRRMMAAIAALAVLTHYVVLPVWDYFRLPPETRAVLSALGRPAKLATAGPMPLGTLLKQLRVATAGPKSAGVPVYVDPIGLSEAGAGIESTVVASADRLALKDQLNRTLGPLGLGYYVRDGLLMVTSRKSADRELSHHPKEARRP